MASLSTHVINSSAPGGGRVGMSVDVHDATGRSVGDGVTDEVGRVALVATDLATGSYRVSWETGGDFLSSVSIVIELRQNRHYHLPLLVSDVSAVTYLGA